MPRTQCPGQGVGWAAGCERRGSGGKEAGSARRAGRISLDLCREANLPLRTVAEMAGVSPARVSQIQVEIESMPPSGYKL
jgi:hypothetical protein